jgi:hypothetical protein
LYFSVIFCRVAIMSESILDQVSTRRFWSSAIAFAISA